MIFRMNFPSIFLFSFLILPSIVSISYILNKIQHLFNHSLIHRQHINAKFVAAFSFIMLVYSSVFYVTVFLTNLNKSRRSSTRGSRAEGTVGLCFSFTSFCHNIMFIHFPSSDAVSGWL